MRIANLEAVDDENGGEVLGCCQAKWRWRGRGKGGQNWRTHRFTRNCRLVAFLFCRICCMPPLSFPSKTSLFSLDNHLSPGVEIWGKNMSGTFCQWSPLTLHRKNGEILKHVSVRGQKPYKRAIIRQRSKHMDSSCLWYISTRPFKKRREIRNLKITSSKQSN